MDHAQLAALPKAELHLHIEGTLEPELAFTLARRNGITLPFASIEDLRSRYDYRNLQSFLDLYYALTDVLRTAEDFRDLTAAYLARAARDGVRHAEIFFDPQAHRRRGVPLAAVLEGLQAAVSASRDVSVYLIPCFLRDLGPDAAMETLGELLPFAGSFAAVGLDSAEVGYPPELFVDVFARARAEGLPAVAHAGEEGPPEYIRQALDLLRVRRVDHGVRCLDDPELVARLADEQIPLTVCPLSNVRLAVVPDLAAHPLPRMLDAGLAVTLNSDDPAYFGGYVGEVYARTAETFGLSAAEVHRLAETSVRASFLPPAARQRLLGA
ncbi:adenosine deaminase [Saccharomonospora sp. NPDC046836]|uniref:adenosine deaminase n=1 Tax=Saccharomonospora sp. NPDC046836 TaxID=3156921 RepID=UPI0033C341BC